MLPIVLVLLVATSALAAPSVNLSVRSINEIPIPIGLEAAFLISDGGDLNVHIVTIQDIIRDLVKKADSPTKALVLGQIIAILIELGSGVPGDACDPATFIEKYIFAVNTGNTSALRAALKTYVQSLVRGIDIIVRLANNPNAGRFAIGPKGNCSNGGRVYNFETAWKAILGYSNPAHSTLMNEAYCTSKRLYSAFNARTNNVGAGVTAVSLPPVNRVFQKALGPVLKFVQSIPDGTSAVTAIAAKAALLDASNTVVL